MDFVYRELGSENGLPLILMVHLAGVLDNWDPRLVDGIAARRRVIAFDNRGVGGSGGSTPDTIEAMARDAVLFIRALGFDRVDSACIPRVLSGPCFSGSRRRLPGRRGLEGSWSCRRR